VFIGYDGILNDEGFSKTHNGNLTDRGPMLLTVAGGIRPASSNIRNAEIVGKCHFHVEVSSNLA